MSQHQRAEQLKLLGNQEFKAKNYQKALQYYQESLKLTPTNPVLYTNQAIVKIAIHEYHSAKQDCESALKLDNKLYKAHFYFGISEFHLKNYPQSEKSFVKSISLTSDASLVLKIRQCLMVCRKKKFYSELELKKQVNRELYNYILKMDQHYQPMNDKDREDKYLKKFQLESYFQLEEHDLTVPEAFQCPITMEIMMDPWVTSSGISYEKQAILEHLKQNGEFDPMTRKTCRIYDLQQNVNLKNYIESFLEKNPWAFPHETMGF
jgi:STIP1 family protein 1